MIIRAAAASELHHNGGRLLAWTAISAVFVIASRLAHDAERLALRRALGFTSHHYPMADHYEPRGDAEWMYGRRGHTDPVFCGRCRRLVAGRWRYRAQAF